MEVVIEAEAEVVIAIDEVSKVVVEVVIDWADYKELVDKLVLIAVEVVAAVVDY